MILLCCHEFRKIGLDMDKTYTIYTFGLQKGTTMKNIANRVRTIVAEHLGAREEQVVEHVLMDDLGADSLDHVELALIFEEEFDIEIPDDGQVIRTFGDVVALVMSECEKQGHEQNRQKHCA